MPSAPTEENPNQTYRELLRSIRVILKKKYSQKAQLSSSHHIVRVFSLFLTDLLTREMGLQDTNLRFII
ncbi:hypothetical protein TRAPUB_6264 [Trametes pubescens]|uniref:Uncharacterized protein n=1 Tax=Trametes pubescens TaxID=154538 RepID=A0A1M2V6I3_TRAPU|nr:hypothetical protein TRAPUB_6264 [Trametes pubescens]